MKKKSLLRRFLNSLRIQKKLTVTLLPIILLTYVILICSMYLTSFQETKKLIDTQANIVANQKVQVVDSYLMQLRTETEVFMFDSSFQKNLCTNRKTLTPNLQEKLDKAMYQHMYSMLINYDFHIESITLTNTYNNFYLWRMNHHVSRSDFTDRICSFKKECRVLDGGVLYNYDKLEDGLVTIARLIKSPQTGKEIGFLMIDFNLEFLYNMSKPTSDFDDTDIFLAIVNENGNFIYNSSPISEEELKNLDLSEKIFRYQNNQYQIGYTASENNDWTLFTIVNHNNLYRNINRTFLFQILLILCLLLVVLFIIIIVSRMISQQFRLFIETVSQTTEPDKHALISVTSNDEFRDLAQVYNDMILRINHLIDTIYTKELVLKNSELKALQAQINPHFLYNTLECINVLVDLDRKEDIKKTVSALANIMRMSIKGPELLTLRENMQLIDQYMFIEKLRFQDKLIFLNDIPEQLMDYYIPKLIIQPILENSLLHGISELLGQGMIGIFGKETEDSIYLIIKDNGVGFPQKVIDSICDNTKETSSNINTQKSIGLYNIQCRIHLLYGSKYGLMIENLPFGGSSVTIHLPKITSPDPSANKLEKGNPQ